MKNLMFLLAIAGITAFGSSQLFAQHPDIGQIKLKRKVSPRLISGAGVKVLHVAAGRVVKGKLSYSPAKSAPQLENKTYKDLANRKPGVNSHATAVGIELYGDSAGVAPGVGEPRSPPIYIARTSEWVFGVLGANHAGDANPDQKIALFKVDVSNHSYILNLSNFLKEEHAINALQRLDCQIEHSEMTTVVGTANRNKDSAGKLPALHIQAHNVIGVGRSDSLHAYGKTTLCGKGRLSIDVVAPKRDGVKFQTVSGAVPIVSGVAAVLHQSGKGSDATRSEVMKAIILAGATKNEFKDWNRTVEQPLDQIYGAGEVNIYNSYFLQQGGESNGSPTKPETTTRLNSWDYEQSIQPGQQRLYKLRITEKSAEIPISIALCWNIKVGNSGKGKFIPTTSLPNLSLQLYKVTDGEDDELIDSSDSPVDNLEHIYAPRLAPGEYHLRVFNAADDSFDTDYGLAIGQLLLRR